MRRITLDPFVVTLYTDPQFDCLMLLYNEEKSVTVFFDATGGVVKHAGKVIYYYAAVARDTTQQLKEQEKRKIIPIFEAVSGAHDAFNIGLVLLEFKHHFDVKYPKMEWPIKNVVCDMSYALMNAVCHTWNKMKLIDYINLTYEAASGSLQWSDLTSHGIVTFIRTCCCHMPKNYSKDVNEYYPHMSPEQQAVLKEIFASMFDVIDLQQLRTIWTHFSTILLSRYSNENVATSMKELARIASSSKKNEVHNDLETDDETANIDESKNDWKLPDSDEHETIYRASHFYENFKTLTFADEFREALGRNDVNPYHCPKFCDMFLQKYVSVLSLWTCSPRFANSPAESHFKNTKKEAHDDAVEIGSMPLKCGRFVRFLKKRVCRVSRSIIRGAPRYRNTRNKRKQLLETEGPPTKKRKLTVTSIMGT